MRPFRFFFHYTKGQRKGIVALFLLIITIQIIYFVVNSYTWESKEQQTAEAKQWLALQAEIDSLKTISVKKGTKIYPFNPNYISNYKAKLIGLSKQELSRIRKFRKTNKYVNSAKEFQEVTKVSDSLLKAIEPYFKFPDWVKKRNSGEIEIYPFNPNYISDYKAKLIGLSKQELSRIRKFRETNKYVNSAKEFQEVTKVSDSLLKTIEPYFKFPDWVVEKQRKNGEKIEIYPFNPNYISDYKATLIGLSKQELARIRKFRKTNKYVNSAKEFQEVTKVSDSLLKTIEPYFKFPNWVNERNARNKANKVSSTSTTIIDINKATAKELITVHGIGPAYAKRILKRRSQLGAFVNINQIDDFTAFSPRAKKELKEGFAIKNKPKVKRINVNTASIDELSSFVYFNKQIARSIVVKRDSKGRINSVEELTKINGFPTQKQNIIALYLEF
ncbi:MAG: hypothetical protein BM557_04665 [Flavobacterium sp. MedPE-SWcel]|uniref:ComEA family DNA-binding protein n=1 Tax=uncultured Flavobacterium sp. TaxID=165435 RepID=UPI000913DC9A|nr:helix-hairpin-helix domain-containing protein [uncultured Flavobacterium sp.]OIQ21052.1 MAG: hypothetical protein BM557_04665 [Flavobacterium sp. MedPE-SWcel]